MGYSQKKLVILTFLNSLATRKMDNDKYIFSLEMAVRDYELDSEGIVNNAVYQNYLEWTRHEFCRKAGMSFAQMRDNDIIPVVNRIEIDYKHPLASGDIIVSKLWVEMKGVRFVFHQDIFNKSTREPVINAIVSIVCLENGTLSRGECLKEIFKPYLTE